MDKVMAVADKTDGVIITLKVSKSDLEALKPITDEMIDCIPTHAHHIIKNRGGKWVGVVAWVQMDLDTINVEKECFVTSQDHELIYGITPIEIT